MFKLQEEAQKVTDGCISQVDIITGGKEKEVMAV
jgi:ribosome recycling factor